MLAAPNRTYKIKSKIGDSLQLRPNRVILRLTVMKFNTLFEEIPCTTPAHVNIQRTDDEVSRSTQQQDWIVVVSLCSGCALCGSTNFLIAAPKENCVSA